MASSPIDAGASARPRSVLGARFSLYEDWQRILRHAWSVRFIVAAGLLEAVSTACGFFTDVNDPILRIVLAALGFVCTALALFARLVQQKSLGDDA